MEGVLDALNTWFSQAPDAERRRLWNVLSALRGPDLPELGDKAATTAVLRLAALPALQGWGHVEVAEAVRDIPLAAAGSLHFHAHVYTAARALGIEARWVVGPLAVRLVNLLPLTWPDNPLTPKTL
jgi:hypothetical protein